MILKPTEICPYADNCRYHHKNEYLNFCQGTVERDNEFFCQYVDINGNISENGQLRNSLDITGKMKLIME